MTKVATRGRWAEERDDRVRVLLECVPEASPSIIASLIERDGYDVRTCEGPTGSRCDLLETGSCALVAGADVVVDLMGTSTIERSVVDAMAALPDPPPIVDERGKVWRISRRTLLDDIRRAIGDR